VSGSVIDAERRRDAAPARRPPSFVGRCERCLTPTVRRSRDNGFLCSSCAAGERAIDQALRAEPGVQAQLYGPSRTVQRLEPRS
jgi:hypothetical protein